MINQLRADWYRQWHSVGLYLVFGFTVIYGLLVSGQHMLGGIAVNAPQKILNDLAAKNWTVLDNIHAATMSSTVLLYVFIALFVIVVGYEFSQATYKNTLITGLSRLSFVLTKYLLLLVDLCIGSLLYFGSVIGYAFSLGAKLGGAATTLWRQGLLLGVITTFFMSVVLALAVLLLLATGSMVLATVFIVVWPLLISLINAVVDWHWLAYLDFFNSAMKIALGSLPVNAQWHYLGVSALMLVIAVFGAAAIIGRREL